VGTWPSSLRQSAWQLGYAGYWRFWSCASNYTPVL